MTKKILEITAWSDTGSFVAPKAFAEFLSFWKDKLSLIPVEFQDTAQITTWMDEDHAGCHYMVWEVTYRRLETDEEYSNRLELEKAKAESLKEKELKLLESLKVKCGEGL